MLSIDFIFDDFQIISYLIMKKSKLAFFINSSIYIVSSDFMMFLYIIELRIIRVRRCC